MSAGESIENLAPMRRIDERFRRSLEDECVYLHALETGSDARRDIASWISDDTAEATHSRLQDATPNEAYAMRWADELAA